MPNASQSRTLTWAGVFVFCIAAPCAFFLLALLLTLGNLGIAVLVLGLSGIPVTLFVVIFAISRLLSRLGFTVSAVTGLSERLSAKAEQMDARSRELQRRRDGRGEPLPSLREAARIGIRRAVRGEWRSRHTVRDDR